MPNVLRAFRQLPFHVEFTAVLLIAFGLFCLQSYWAFLVLLFPSPMDPAPAPMSSALAWAIVRYELFVLVLVGTGLWLRGWNLRCFDVRPTLALTLVGVALFVVQSSLYGFAFSALSPLFPDALLGESRVREALAVSASMSIASIVALSLVNACFEELFVVGYITHALRDRKSRWFIINVSTAMRLLYHLYQGAFGVLASVPIGIVFGWWYARTGRLWPLIVAHALLDITMLVMARGL